MRDGDRDQQRPRGSIDSLPAHENDASTMALERVLEPEVMDSEEEAREYDAMDHASVNAAFCGDLLAHKPDLRTTLDVGTGTALIPIEICRRSPSAHIIAIDLATSMLTLAVKNVERAGLTEKIEIALVDAKSLPYESGSFGCVISNSILHHIPDPLDVLKEMLRVIAPGGCLFVRDLLRPASDAEVSALVNMYTGGAPDRQRALLDASLRASFTLDELREMARAVAIPEDAMKVTSDRHWTLAYRPPQGAPFLPYI
jgi:ubiquinone/menaquinone biosynthesis C-methylase UbiE